MKRFSCIFFALLLFLSFLRQADAKTITVAHPTFDAVNAAVGSAQDGDIVQLSAETVTWSTTLEVTKAITLQGMGKNATVINLSTDVRTYAIHIGGSHGANLVRLSGFAIDGHGSGGGVFVDASNSQALRLDNLIFRNTGFKTYDSLYAKAVYFHGYKINAVVDHADFLNNSADFGNIGADMSSWDFTTDPYGLGTENGVFVEDCTFTDTATRTATSDLHFINSQGARTVFRHNIVNFNTGSNSQEFWDQHGNNNLLPANTSRGTVYSVIENNMLTIQSCLGGGKMTYIRGGTFIYNNNTLTTVCSWPIVFTEEETWDFGTNSTTSYPREDQVTNSWVYNNSINGNPMTASSVYTANSLDTSVIQSGRDYWVNVLPPAYNGANPLGDPSKVPNPKAYGYTPAPYPHSLVKGNTAAIPVAPKNFHAVII